jgi:flagellar hook assembly protein FlgD
LPVAIGAQRASVIRDRGFTRRVVAIIGSAALLAIAVQLAPVPAIAPARATSAAVPKAVFIVGPTSGLTNSNLADAEKMAEQAEAAGMEVHRVFFPHATWDNVLANIQNANLVVYMGHGYGWPSPYTKELTESRQDGMGLNTFDGSGQSDYTYYGASRLRESIHLAPNAIVYLNHLCYASGNAEPGMAIPDVGLAEERADNMASGWLSIGARAVFAYGWWQRLNYPAALMTTNETMDQLFMTPAPGGAAGSPAGYTNWNESRSDSTRTPNATIHLDPHKKYGYYRAVTGDLSMTAGDWRAEATGTIGGGGNSQAGPPQITSFRAAGSTTGDDIAAGNPPSFHPNGDGIDDTLVLTHTLTRAAHLDATVANSSGTIVRRYSVFAETGTSTSTWDGRNDAGSVVPDGRYTLTYTPRDDSGATGSPVSVEALVLTAVKLGKPSSIAFFARDADETAQQAVVTVTVSEQASVSFKVVNSSGKVIRTVRPLTAAAPGTLKFSWDGTREDGSWAADGWYQMLVTATTSAGSYSQARGVYAGAFRITPSISSPARGNSLTLSMTSTESLSAPPSVQVAQPGLAPWTATATRIQGKKYKITLSLKPGGNAGTLVLDVTGVDKNGGTQDTKLSLTLR